jgi:hypothetical protein
VGEVANSAGGGGSVSFAPLAAPAAFRIWRTGNSLASAVCASGCLRADVPPASEQNRMNEGDDSGRQIWLCAQVGFGAHAEGAEQALEGRKTGGHGQATRRSLLTQPRQVRSLSRNRIPQG